MAGCTDHAESNICFARCSFCGREFHHGLHLICQDCWRCQVCDEVGGPCNCRQHPRPGCGECARGYQLALARECAGCAHSPEPDDESGRVMPCACKGTEKE